MDEDHNDILLAAGERILFIAAHAFSNWRKARQNHIAQQRDTATTGDEPERAAA